MVLKEEGLPIFMERQIWKYLKKNEKHMEVLDFDTCLHEEKKA